MAPSGNYTPPFGGIPMYVTKYLSSTPTCSTSTGWTIKPSGTTASCTWNYSLADCEEEWYGGARHPSKKLVPGSTYDLPNGAKIKLNTDGSYVIDDKDAKVVYKSAPREFSPHMNASDMLAQFVKFVGGMGLRRDEIMGLPIHLFINWLVLEAAERDGDETDLTRIENDPMILAVRKPRCLDCGRFVRRINYQHRFPYCSPEHGARHIARLPMRRQALGAPT